MKQIKRKEKIKEEREQKLKCKWRMNIRKLNSKMEKKRRELNENWKEQKSKKE